MSFDEERLQIGHTCLCFTVRHVALERVHPSERFAFRGRVSVCMFIVIIFFFLFYFLGEREGGAYLNNAKGVRRSTSVGVPSTVKTFLATRPLTMKQRTSPSSTHLALSYDSFSSHRGNDRSSQRSSLPMVFGWALMADISMAADEKTTSLEDEGRTDGLSLQLVGVTRWVSIAA